MKIFIGFTDVAGYFTKLRNGFLSNGHACDLVEWKRDWRSYSAADKQIYLVILIQKISKIIISANSRTQLAFLSSLQIILKILFFIRSVYKYDAYIFTSNESFFSGTRLQNLDLLVLSTIRKKTYFVCLGSESRPGYISRPYQVWMQNKTDTEYIDGLYKQKDNLKNIEKYATYILNHPPMAHYLTRPFIQMLAVGSPAITPEVFIECQKNRMNTSVRILHAPSHPEIKGTEHIRKCLQELSDEGHKFEYIEIMRKSNDEVLKEIRKCDFVVDQVYSDYPLPMFALEAASYNKPAIIGGYYVDYIDKDIEQSYIPTSYFCHPDKIKDAIKTFILDHELRISYGNKAADFVRHKWNAKTVASRYIAIIKGEVPDAWLYNPNYIRYMHGQGYSESEVQQSIYKAIEIGGLESLQLLDKPILQNNFMKFSSKYIAHW